MFWKTYQTALVLAVTLGVVQGLGGMSAQAQTQDPQAKSAQAQAPADAVPAAYLAPEWRLVSINGTPFTARATIDLSKPAEVTGQGPCNRYFGAYEGKLPAFRPAGVASTRMACAEMAAEQAFFLALADVSYAEVTKAEGKPQVLILSGDKGHYLEFARPVN